MALQLQESFWRFKIPEHKLDVPVLVVGHVSEPRVAFDRPSLSFGKVLVGGRTHATINLLNSEYMPFQFDLDKASYDASPARLESTGLSQSSCMVSMPVTLSCCEQLSLPGHVSPCHPITCPSSVVVLHLVCCRRQHGPGHHKCTSSHIMNYRTHEMLHL